MIEQKLIEKINLTEKKLKELDLYSQSLERKYQQILSHLEMTSEGLEEYLENSENFTKEIWEQMEDAKKILDERLKMELDSLADPAKTKRTLSEKGRIMHHWLFVR